MYFQAENEAYIYWNRADLHWWIDLPSGAGAYICESSSDVPPTEGWRPVTDGIAMPVPTVRVEVFVE